MKGAVWILSVLSRAFSISLLSLQGRASVALRFLLVFGWKDRGSHRLHPRLPNGPGFGSVDVLFSAAEFPSGLYCARLAHLSDHRALAPDIRS